MSNQVQQIIDELVKNYQPEKVILFGSRSGGEIHEDSDVDLVVIKKTAKRFTDRIEEASSSFKHILPVDVIVYTPKEFTRMSQESWFIRDEVVKKGQVVYG